jgi:hypothetical protein
MLGACQRGDPATGGGVPIQAYDNIPFTGNATTNQRGDQIKRAAIAQGWVIEERGPRLLRATYTLRRYQAVVEIPYTNGSFSIRYVSSQNLETAPGFVLRDYNSWVDRLQRAIVTGR